MLGQVRPTDFDLYFPFFGTPVRVTPWFWLIGVVTGWPFLSANQVDRLLIWIGVLFVSILVHELGHAIAGRCFGWPSSVFLYHLGGVTVYPYRTGETTGRSIVTSFAGPWAGFLLFGLTWGIRAGLNAADIHYHYYIEVAFQFSIWINFYWTLVNLAPVYPLDGGQIAHAALSHYRGRKGEAWTYQIGMAVAAALAAYFFMQRMRFAGFLFAFLAVENYQRYELHKRGYW